MSLPMTWRSAGHHRWNSLQVVREAGAGDVVDQRVVPDVDRAGGGVPGAVGELRAGAVLADGKRDAPGGARAADREVLEALADEAQHLVAPVVRLDEVRVRLVVREQALLVGRRRKNQLRSESRWRGASGWLGHCIPVAVSCRSEGPWNPRSGSTSRHHRLGRCRRWRTRGGPSPGRNGSDPCQWSGRPSGLIAERPRPP